jgi:hypothetical protein
MDPIDQPRRARLSAGAWLFQLTTITIGVLIALSFDALLQWNADRKLVEEARATIALEIADNLRELDAHLASYDERVAKLDDGLKLLAELEAGVEPTIHEVTLGMDFPSLNDAGWQTAGRTGAMALMEYSEVQELAELYTLQALFTDTLRPVLAEAIEAGVIMNSPGRPFAIPVVRDAVRARLFEVRGKAGAGPAARRAAFGQLFEVPPMTSAAPRLHLAVTS